MFARRVSISLVSILTAMLLGITPAIAGTKTSFTIDVPFTNNSFTLGQTATPAGNLHAWDSVGVGTFTSTDARFQGEITFHTQFLLCKETHPLPCWGPLNAKWTLDVDSDGQPDWEGISHGLPQNVSIVTIRFVGHGLGKYDGLQVTADYHLNLDSGSEAMTGEILDPH